MAPHAPLQRPARRRSGFSLVELLVVIGIIALLATILTVGITSVRGKIADRSTKTRLEALDAMLAAYAQADSATGGAIGRGGAKKLPSVVEPVQGSGKLYSTVDDQTPNAGALATFSSNGMPVPAPDLAMPDAVSVDAGYARTQGVLSTLLRVPANQKAFDALPTETKIGPQAYVAKSLLNGGARRQGDPPAPLVPPLMVDAHDTPILYVPPTGLTGLNFGDGRTNVTLIASDGRGFWASAGPDKLFISADDNVYSTPTIIKQP